MKVQSDCDTPQHHPSQLAHSHSGSKMKLRSQRREENPHHNNQMHVRKSEFESMEESLREALRHGNGSTVTKLDVNKHHAATHENSDCVRQHFVKAFDQEEQVGQAGNYRNFANVSESYRTPMQHQPLFDCSTTPLTFDLGRLETITVEKFRRYCGFLTDRVRKMEEQNVQLLRIAEKQKAEYDKVAAQVVQSEQSQRLLLNECKNLRKQVEQLANSNKRLREQHLISAVMHSANSPLIESPPESATSDGFPGHNLLHPRNEATNDPSVNNSLHSGPENHIQNGSILDRKQVNDLTKIIELYSALQRATIADLNIPDASGSSKYANVMTPTEKTPYAPLNIIHEHPDHPTGRFETSDYVSPPGGYGSPSCSCCTPHSHCRFQFPQSAPSPYLPQRKLDHKAYPAVQQRVIEQTKPRSHSDSCQSFDNNAYVEVELKSGKRLEGLQRQPFHSPGSSSTPLQFRRDNRMRRSHNHYRNLPAMPAEQPRPSSLVLDMETAQALFPSQSYDLETQFQPALPPPSLALSPISPRDNQELTRQNLVSSRCNDSAPLNTRTFALNQQMNFEPKLRIARKYSSSGSCLSDPRQPAEIDTCSNDTRKTASKSNSTSELTPIPAKDQTDKVAEPPVRGVFAGSELDRANRRSRSSSADGILAPLASNRSKVEQNEDLRMEANKGFTGKLTAWTKPNYAQVRQSAENGSNSASAEAGANWRRSSYARACRKSQSLDHLYEQVSLELEKSKGKAPDFFGGTHEQENNKFVAGFPFPENIPEEVEDFPPSSFKSDNNNEDAPDCSLQSRQSETKSNPFHKVQPLKLSLSINPEFSCDAAKPSLSPTTTESKHQRLPLPLKNRLLKKQFRARSHEEAVTGNNGTEHSTEDVEENAVDIAMDEEVFVPNTNNDLINRRLNEGSTEHQQFNKINSNDVGKKAKLHRSISADGSVTKQKSESSSKTSSSPSSGITPAKVDHDCVGVPHVANSSPHIQSRLLSSKPHSRLQALPSKRKTENAKLIPKQIEEKSGCVHPNAPPSPQGRQDTKLPQSEEMHPHKEYPAGTKLPSAQKASAVLEENSVCATKASRDRSATKLSKKSKDNPPDSNDKNKKGSSGSRGAQSKSLVDIMKAKFSRSSSSGGRSNSAGKKRGGDNSKVLEDFVIKPPSSLIDHRTLSLEPNSYLPPGKDGSSARKASKQKEGQISEDDVVGRKLSQHSPIGIGEDYRQENQLNKINEEVLSDEGFAEGSTIERADKEDSRDTELMDDKPQAEVSNTSPCRDGSLTTAEPGLEMECSDADYRMSEKNNMIKKKETSEWYESVEIVDKNPDDATDKRFQIVETEMTRKCDALNEPSINQKHTKSKIAEETSHENYPLEEKLTAKVNNFKNVDLCRSMCNIPEANRVELLTTGVTILPSSALNQSRSCTPQPMLGLGTPVNKVNPPIKLPKPSPGGALGRLMKSVSNHYTGSKEDLGPSRGASPLPTAGKDSKKQKVPDCHRMLEKSFMQSVIQAELAQNLSQRNSLAEPSTPDALKDSTTCPLQFPSVSGPVDSLATGSVGTGSSFGSLPSDGLDSNHSGDVLDYAGITSSGSSDSPVKQPVHRMSKNKRDHMTSFGFGSNLSKTGTGGSNVSSSSSELNFKARSKLPGSGLKSPAINASLAPKEPPTGKISASTILEKQHSPGFLRKNKDYPTELQLKRNLNPISVTASNLKPQVAPRPPKKTTPTKLTPPGKLQDVRGSGKKTPERQSPTSRTNPVVKTKLAPLGFGPSGTREFGTRDKTDVTSNTDQVKRVILNSQRQASNLGNALTTPTENQSVASLDLSHPLVGCRPSHVENKRVKKSIPTSGLLRPRPIHPGIGAS